MRRLALVACALLLAGCGGGGTDLDAQAASVLQKDSQALAAAARAGNAAQVGTALAALRSHVTALQSAGEIGDARAARVLDAAQAVAADVPTPRPVVRPSPTKAPVVVRAPAPRQEEHKGKGKDDKGD